MLIEFFFVFGLLQSQSTYFTHEIQHFLSVDLKATEPKFLADI